MQIVKAGLLYFALDFGAVYAWSHPHSVGRPRLDGRMAWLLEMFIMFVATIAAARSIARRMAVSPTLSSRLGTSGIALSLRRE